MDNLSRRFNEMLMQEMGFDVQTDGTLVDQDIGIPIIFEGVPVVSPSIPIQKGESSITPFDPYNNTRMMNFMFSHFVSKMTEMGEIDYFNAVFNKDTPDGKGVIVIQNDSAEISSKAYVRESCKYADLVFQLNGDDVPDMKEFDIAKSVQRDMIKKDHKKRTTKKSSKG